MRETRFRSLGWEDPLEKAVATTPVFLPGKSHRRRIRVGYSPWDRKESDTTERLPFLSFLSLVEKRAVLCLVTQLCPTLWDPMHCSLPVSSVHGASAGKNIGVGCHALLQGIFPTQGLNSGLPHCWQIVYCLSHQGSPKSIQFRALFTSERTLSQGRHIYTVITQVKR